MYIIAEKPREIQRLKRLEVELKERDNRKALKVEREKEREKGGKRVEEKEKEAGKKRKRKGRNQILHEEWEQLANEERIHKKMKKGKISEEELRELEREEEEIMGESDEEGEGERKEKGKKRFGKKFKGHSYRK